MKQVQVLKKTLLSLAVVSAFGGYGSATKAQQDSPSGGGSSATSPPPPAATEGVKKTKPSDKVDFDALRKKSEGITVDASKMGLDVSLVKRERESEDQFNNRVKKAVDKFNNLPADDFRKMLLMKNPKAEPGKEEYVVPEVIRLKGFDLRTRELAVAFGLRIVEGVKPELYDSSNPVSDRAVVLASKLGTVELDGFKNSLESRLPDVSFANPDNPASKEPYGTYVVAEGSDVYQLSVGGKKSIDAFIVEKSKFRANGSVSASKVLIKDADIRIAHEAGSIATQNLVVEGSSKISLVDEDTDEKKKSLTTILGANLTKDSVDTFKIGKGSEVWANVKDYEEGTVGGTLISNKIGSPAKQINKLD